MTPTTRLKILKIVLLVFGAFFVVGVYPLTKLWPPGFVWHTDHEGSEYLVMILGIYATLGVFLMLASRNPLDNLSLIWFTVWSSFVHGGIMLVQALMNPMHQAHLLGDVPAIFLVAIVLAIFTPRGGQARALRNVSEPIASS